MNALVSYVPNPFASILTGPYYANSPLNATRRSKVSS